MPAPYRAAARWLCAIIPALLAGGCTERQTQTEITHLVTLIDQQLLRQHVESLATIGPRSDKHPEALSETIHYISARLREYAVSVVEEPLGVPGDETTSYGQGVNLIATFPGLETPDRIFEIGAHYDTVETTPGADDNASGIAALLEIARVLSRVPTHSTIRLCFFAEEEVAFGGSSRHVRNIEARNESIDGAIILEMIGYTSDRPGSQASPARVPLLFWPPRTGNFIAVIGNFRSGSVGNRFEAAAVRYVPELRLFSANRLGGLFKDALRSDHKPYWDQGHKAIMLTDTANFRNPHYHRPSDTADTLDYGFLTAVTRANLATVLSWSGLDSSSERLGP